MTTVVLACVWLAALSSCDGMKSEQSRRDYQDELVTELCAPGAFYRECWWLSAEECHRAMPEWVAVSFPDNEKRVRPTRALRQHLLKRLAFYHFLFLGYLTPPAFEKAECMDGARWKHLPPGEERAMVRLRARREKTQQRDSTDRSPAGYSGPDSP